MNKFIFYFLFTMMFTSTAFATTTLYGLEQGLKLHSQDPKSSYRLQVGTFSSEQNAKQCRKKLAQKTSLPVQIKSLARGRLHTVSIEPISHKENISQLSALLLRAGGCSASPKVAKANARNLPKKMKLALRAPVVPPGVKRPYTPKEDEEKLRRKGEQKRLLNRMRFLSDEYQKVREAMRAAPDASALAMLEEKKFAIQGEMNSITKEVLNNMKVKKASIDNVPFSKNADVS